MEINIFHSIIIRTTKLSPTLRRLKTLNNHTITFIQSFRLSKKLEKLSLWTPKTNMCWSISTLVIIYITNLPRNSKFLAKWLAVLKGPMKMSLLNLKLKGVRILSLISNLSESSTEIIPKIMTFTSSQVKVFLSKMFNMRPTHFISLVSRFLKNTHSKISNLWEET